MFAAEAGKLIREKKLGCRELTEEYIKRIKKTDSQIGAYISINEEDALDAAEKVQQRILKGEKLSQKGSLSLLAGVPVAVKDNICTKDLKTTCGSRILENFIPPYNATVIEKMKNAGMIVLGKTNMDEFAMGSTGETSAFGVTRNPWNLNKVPGGSGSGSAAAVAAGEAIIALGSDTGGSVRLPAACCGITGFKPTYGTVSRYGLISYASSMDQIGTTGLNAEDCGALLGIISGNDRLDSTSLNIAPLDFTDCNGENLKGMKIGVEEHFTNIEVVDVFRRLGAEIKEFSMPLKDYVVPAYYIISCAEASSNLSRYDGVRYSTRTENYSNLRELYIKSRSENLGTEVKRRIMLGTFVLGSGYYDDFYLKARNVRKVIAQEYKEVFRKYDLILTPVTTGKIPDLGTSLNSPVKMYEGDIYTVTANLTGLPAMSLPCGSDSQGMPAGMQLMGKPLGESTIMKAAVAFQSVTDYHMRRPAI